jgi:two-component system response regulator LytT
VQPAKIGIVEDEAIIAERLIVALLELGYRVTKPVGTYTEALVMLEEEKPDLVMLDITLRGTKDGIDVAWKIKERYNIPFIYLSAHSDAATVVRAKLTQPPAYLVKPFHKKDLFASLEVCLYNFSSQAPGTEPEDTDSHMAPDGIFTREGKCFNKILFSDILYIETNQSYVNVVTLTRTIMVRIPLQQYVSNLKSDLFMQVHRCYVVNLLHIDTINSDSILIKDIKIPLSRTVKATNILDKISTL